jgi:ABC-type branched-subunit amino acid transport system substrate-binding protein
MTDDSRTAAPRLRARTRLGLTAGQWQTIVLAVLLAAALLITTLPHTGSSSSDASSPAATGDVQDDGSGLPMSSSPTGVDSISDVAQGVTDTTIKVGVVLLDLSSVVPLGLGLPNYEIEIQQAAYQSLFDEINANGGINGRTIEPVYESRDTLATTGPHSDKAICLKLAKDEQVFAVIGMTYAAGECAATQYGLPVVTKNASLEQYYQDSNGLLVTFDPTLERDERDWASVLVKTGVVDDHTVGMVSVADGSTYQLPGQAAAETLEKLGHPLAVVGQLDPANSIADIPALIQKMKSAGVDQVMLASDFANALRFIAIAESQHYFPQYLTSDLGSLSSNGLLANAGDSFDGAIGFSDSNASELQNETPQQQECRENYNATTTTKDIPAGVQSPLGVVCSVVDVFAHAATDAGTDLSPRSFIKALQALGTVSDDVSAVLPGAFAPGKSDYSDQLQQVVWSSAAKQYQPVGDPVDVNTDE